PKFRTETGKAVFTLKGHSSSVSSVAFSPDGKRLATGALRRPEFGIRKRARQTSRSKTTRNVNSVAFSGRQTPRHRR
ncbi:MAG: hypothetical protein IPL65_09480, partial [Lewinellaceae bacterium]|nr:hypothetical protein [Lewinellaceae bacterium]